MTSFILGVASVLVLTVLLVLVWAGVDSSDDPDDDEEPIPW